MVGVNVIEALCDPPLVGSHLTTSRSGLRPKRRDRPYRSGRYFSLPTLGFFLSGTGSIGLMHSTRGAFHNLPHRIPQSI
jgi:hypothetical protein